MNKLQQKKIAKEIVEMYNKGDEPSKKYALNKLKMAKFILQEKTYLYLAKKMGEKISYADNEKLESDKTLILAQKLLGGKIVDENT